MSLDFSLEASAKGASSFPASATSFCVSKSYVLLLEFYKRIFSQLAFDDKTAL